MKKILFLCVAVLVFASFDNPVHAQSHRLEQNLRAAILEPTADFTIGITHLIHAVEDPEGKLTPQSALRALNNKTISPSDFDPDWMEADKVYWFAFALRNDASYERIFVVDFGKGNKGEIYQILRGYPQPFQESIWQSGSEKTARHASYLSVPHTKRVFYIARLEKKSPQPLNISIGSLETVLNKETSWIELNSIILGILFILGVYHIVIAISLKEQLYYYQFLFICSGALLFLSTYETHLQYLLPAAARWVHLPPLYPLSLAMAFWLQFTRNYLALPEHKRTLNLGFNILTGVWALPIFLQWTGLENAAGNAAAQAGLISTIAIALAGAWALSRKLPQAPYFLLANSILLFAGLMLSLKHLGWNVPVESVYGAVQLGGILQVCLTSLAVGNRMATLRVEREEALNRDLEHQSQALEEHKQLTEAYARFVPMEFFNLLDKKSILDVQLGDARQHHMTILFSDIRSYTTLCEKMSSADIFRSLNGYLECMGPVIRKQNGFIDKYIGDAIMALFPLAVDHAVTAAVDMMKTLRILNEHRTQHKELPIDIGIGIHSGKLILGTVGEEKRMEGTVISDAVNVSARLENLTRTFGVSIIISEDAFNELKGIKPAFRFLGEVQLKGKTEKTRFFEIFQNEPEETRTLKIRSREAFEASVNLYIQGDYATAAGSFEEITRFNPADKPAAYYLRECRVRLGV